MALQSPAPTPRLPDFPSFAEDNPGFSFGSLTIEPGQDVLCMLCLSGSNQATASELLHGMHDAISLQGGRLWVQKYDTELVGAIVPSTALTGPSVIGGGMGAGGSDVITCQHEALKTLPLPNGNMPVRLVLAFNGHDRPLSSPILNGKVIPTTLVLPKLFDSETITLWGEHSNVDILDPSTLPRFKAAIEGMEARELRRISDTTTKGPVPVASRKRL